MKVYVASKFEEHERVIKLQADLRREGHQITCDWVAHKLAHPGYFKLKPGGIDREMLAIAELSGVQRCDALVVYPHPEGASAYAETVAAIVLGKRVIAISETGLLVTDRTFFFHPDIIWVKNDIAAQYALRNLAHSVTSLI